MEHVVPAHAASRADAAAAARPLREACVCCPDVCLRGVRRCEKRVPAQHCCAPHPIDPRACVNAGARQHALACTPSRRLALQRARCLRRSPRACRCHAPLLRASSSFASGCVARSVRCTPHVAHASGCSARGCAAALRTLAGRCRHGLTAALPYARPLQALRSKALPHRRTSGAPDTCCVPSAPLLKRR
jgi:hypothetical protein